MINKIYITPGMIADEAMVVGATKSVTDLNIPCVTLTDLSTSMIRINTIIPTDWDLSPLKLTIVYTSHGVTGGFYLAINGSGLIYDDALNVGFSAGGQVLPVPTDINVLSKYEVELDFNGSTANYLNLIIRRFALSPLDTSNDQLQIMGFEIEYNSTN